MPYRKKEPGIGGDPTSARTSRPVTEAGATRAPTHPVGHPEAPGGSEVEDAAPAAKRFIRQYRMVRRYSRYSKRPDSLRQKDELRSLSCHTLVVATLATMSPEPLLPALASTALTEIVRAGLAKVIERKRPSGYQFSEAIERSLAHHLAFVATWSARVQNFGMRQPHETQGATVPLLIDDLPRRFSTDRHKGATLSEHDLLRSEGNHAILGDPGAGKTTTIKRLATLLLSTGPISKSDRWAYPVLVVIREHDWVNIRLHDVIASQLGLDPEALPDELGKSWNKFRLLVEFLDAGPAFILIDGLDEVPVSSRAQLDSDLVSLADHLQRAKIVVSCRSGDYRHIDGFALAEIAPLTAAQIETIAHKWLGDAAGFFNQLRDNPAADLVNRPLFLSQLLTLYQNGGGNIPRQPSSLYKQIARLMLQDWDEQRNVVRASAYANFHVEEKMEFLSALSFDLTIERKAVRFDTALLEEIYKTIAPQFGLPRDDAARVAREIETHTGIIVETGDAFEFSHLSLQEYLCGYYLVRQPHSDRLVRYMREYPAPVAVAVALSSDPSLWLSSIVLGAGWMKTGWLVHSFVTRLAQEHPRFRLSDALGHALLSLMITDGGDEPGPFIDLLNAGDARQSVTSALRKYEVRHNYHVQPDRVFITYREEEPRLIRPYGPPQSGGIGVTLFNSIVGP